MFIFAQLCHGFGSTPLYTIGFSYIEDSTSAEDGALYFAIILMGSCLGPAIGFVFGAVQLGVWVKNNIINIFFIKKFCHQF